MASLARSRSVVPNLPRGTTKAARTVQSSRYVKRHVRCGPLTLGDLASREQMAPPSITKAVAKLETLGLVRRSKDDHDRRVFRVEITAKGRRQLEASRTRRTAWLATRLREVSEEDLAVLDAAASVLDRLTSPPETAP